MAGRHGRSVGKKKEEGLWLMSFTDLCFVLMSFFVLLLSWSKIDKSKMDNMQQAMHGKKPPIQVDAKGQPMKGEENLHTLSRELEEIVKRLNMQRAVTIRYDADGLSIEFKDSLLFASGSADMSTQFHMAVDGVMRIVANAPGRYRLVIEGHTDDTLVMGGKFRDNWELSAARGFSLLNLLHSRGIAEERLSVVAYAHTRPKISIRNLRGERLAEARLANRRVVVRLE